ncbi:MAG: gfo/Idh/MocA family oxidoreductase, partial [Blastocatellia bacterium]
MADKVRIAVIGTGFARTVQIPAFLSHPEIEITAIASGSPGKAASVAREFGIPFATDDWRRAIDRKDVDLVCITTPPDLHHRMAIFAAECGKHILCEKPMAMNTEEAEQMALTAEKAGVIALIDHELRFQPGRQRAFSLIREYAIGKILHFRYLFQAPHRGDPNLKWNWWSDINRGGGALGAIGSHIIDAICWIADSIPSAVTGQLHTHVQARPTDSNEKLPVTSDDE